MKDLSLCANFATSCESIGLPWWLSNKKPACNLGDVDLIPGSGRFPGGGHGNPLQYSCLENAMDRGAWWATVHGVTKSQTQPMTTNVWGEGLRAGTAGPRGHSGWGSSPQPVPAVRLRQTAPGQSGPALHTHLWLPGSPFLPPPPRCPMFPTLAL